MDGKMAKFYEEVCLIEQPFIKDQTVTIKELIGQIGPYPHARLVASNRPKTQTTRMLKVTCQQCGCVVRMTRKWLDEAGVPTCGCGGEMAEEEIEEGGDE